MNQQPRSLLVILGTGRSGTSTAARMTRVFSHELGDRLLAANEHNEKGYFEDIDLFNINRALLAALGLVEYSAQPFDALWMDSVLVQSYREEAVAWLKERLSRYPRFAMKDPRVTRLLPFWQAVFADVGIQPRYILAHRDPIVSAVSLNRMLPRYSRNRLLRRLLCHTAAILDLRDEPLAVADFDLTLAQPQSVAREIAMTLGLEIDEQELAAFGDFVTPSLNHARSTDPTLQAQFDPALVAVSTECHQTLIQGGNPRIYWTDVERSLGRLRQVLYDGVPGDRPSIWVTQLGDDEEQSFDQQAIALSHETDTLVLTVKIGDDALSEADQARVQGFMNAPCRHELLLVENAYGAAIKIKDFMDDLKGLYGRVRFPGLNGLGAFVVQACAAGHYPGLEVKVDREAGALDRLDRAGHWLANPEMLVRDALERLMQPPASQSRSQEADPTVTVGISYQGDLALLERTLKAVLGQSYPHLEVCVLSVRGRLNDLDSAIGTLMEAHAVRIVAVDSGGEADLGHALAERASGDWLLLMQAGDLPVVDAVSGLVSEAQRLGADVVESAAFVFPCEDAPDEFNVSGVVYPLGVTPALALVAPPRPMGAVLYRRSLVPSLPCPTGVGARLALDRVWVTGAGLCGAACAVVPQPLIWRPTVEALTVEQEKAYLRAIAQPFFMPSVSATANVARYAQGVHFSAIEQRRAIEALEQDNKLLAQELEGREPLFDRGDLQAQEAFLRATEPARPNQVTFEVIILLPEVDDAHRAGTRHRLRQTLASLGGQWWGGHRLSIVDGNSQPLVSVEEHGGRARIWNEPATGEGGLVSLLNRAVNASQSDWVLPMYAGDTLEPDALYRFRDAVAGGRGATLLYADERVLRTDADRARRTDECLLFKSDFNAVKLRCHAYLGAAVVYRRDAVLDWGGFAQNDLAPAFGYDMMLKLSETGRVLHIDEPVFNRFQATRVDAADAAVAALRQHLSRTGSIGVAEPGVLSEYFRIRYPRSEAPVTVIIWAHTDVTQVQASLEALVAVLSDTPHRLCIASAEQASEEVRLYAEALANEPALAALGVRVVEAVNSFDDLVRHLSTRYALFLNEGGQFQDTALIDRMVGLGTDWQACLFAPNILTSVEGSSVYHSTGCSPFLKLDEQEGRLFAGVSAEQPAIPEGFERLDLIDFWVTAPSVDAFGFDVHAVGEAGPGLGMDAALPARLALSLEAKHERPCTVHVAGNVFVPPSSELRTANGEEPYLPGSLSEQWEAVYGLLPAAHSLTDNKNINSLEPHSLENDLTYRLGRRTRPVPRVLAHAADNQGCGLVRITSPMGVLRASNLIDGGCPEAQLPLGTLARLNPDALIFQRQISDSQVERIRRIGLAAPDVLKVYEIDDLMHQASARNPLREGIEKDVLVRMKRGIESCDRLVVSTNFLANVYGEFASEVRVMPNTIERARWGHLRNVPRGGDRPRVGWAGSVSHMGDLVMFERVLERTAHAIDWVFLGQSPLTLLQYLAEVHEGVPINQYPEKLASLDLDLAVAPVEVTPFNRAKSHLKLLEYGVIGVPVVATDIDPYNEEPFPVTLVRNRSDEWVDALLAKVGDREALRTEGQRLREYVLDHWTTEGNTQAWLSAWLP